MVNFSTKDSVLDTDDTTVNSIMMDNHAQPVLINPNIISDEEFWGNYDYNGAILFVFGFIMIYGGAILFLIIAMIRRSRAELEIIDHLRDLEEIRKKRGAKKRSSKWKLSSLTERFGKWGSVDLEEHPASKLVESRVKMYQSSANKDIETQM